MTEPLDPIAAVTHPDPYAYYERLARTQPLAWNAGMRCWVAASAEAVQAVLDSPLCRVRPPGEPVPPALAGTSAGEVFRRLARMTDGATHATLKAGVLTATAAMDSTAVDRKARRRTRALWREGGWWGAEGIPLGFRLPVHVVAGLLGVPDACLPHVARRTGELVRGMAPGAAADLVAVGSDAATHLTALFSRGGVRRSAPIGALDRSLRAAGCLEPETAAANAVGLLIQTHDATAGLLGNAIVALAENPPMRGEVERDPGLLGDFVDEVLRHDPPVQNTRRWVAEDGVVAGQAMRAGEAVLVLLAAANRDPGANADPHVFRLRRPARRTSGFGHGRHACPGTGIARTIVVAAIAEMMAMRVDLGRLAAGRGYQPSGNTRIPRFACAEDGIDRTNREMP